jgi:hypothetical protein
MLRARNKIPFHARHRTLRKIPVEFLSALYTLVPRLQQQSIILQRTIPHTVGKPTLESVLLLQVLGSLRVVRSSIPQLRNDQGHRTASRLSNIPIPRLLLVVAAGDTAMDGALLNPVGRPSISVTDLRRRTRMRTVRRMKRMTTLATFDRTIAGCVEPLLGDRTGFRITMNVLVPALAQTMGTKMGMRVTKSL